MRRMASSVGQTLIFFLAMCAGAQAQTFNVVQFTGGYPVEPADLPPGTRHLDAHYAAITMTDKVWHPYSLGRERIEDAIEMICIGADDLL